MFSWWHVAEAWYLCTLCSRNVVSPVSLKIIPSCLSQFSSGSLRRHVSFTHPTSALGMTQCWHRKLWTLPRYIDGASRSVTSRAPSIFSRLLRALVLLSRCTVQTGLLLWRWEHSVPVPPWNHIVYGALHGWPCAQCCGGESAAVPASGSILVVAFPNELSFSLFLWFIAPAWFFDYDFATVESAIYSKHNIWWLLSSRRSFWPLFV